MTTVTKMRSEIHEAPDLALEGEALSLILGTLHQLSPLSRDRVLQAVIELAAPVHVMAPADEFVHPGFQTPDSSNILANLEKLREEQGEGDEEGP